MTWLSEIEDAERKYRIKYQKVLRAIGRGEPPETPQERMARVIRELAAYLRDICELKHIDLPDASPDVKELLKCSDG